MVYTNKKFPRRELDFPAPPKWLTWVQEQEYELRSGRWEAKPGSNEGVIRHQDSLSKAKSYVGKWASEYHGGMWGVDWGIYEWDFDKQKYIERYHGKAGQLRTDHPLWSKRIKKADLTRDLPDEEIQAAVESILRGA